MENNANVSSAKRKMEAELEQTREQLKDVEDQVQLVSGRRRRHHVVEGVLHHSTLPAPYLVKPVCQEGVVWSGCSMHVLLLFSGVGFILMNTG